MAGETIRLQKQLGRPLEEDEEMTVIAPAKLLFNFHMGKDECHKKLTGTCALDKSRLFRLRRDGGEAGPDHCPDLLKSIRKRGLLMRIDIIKCSCGHYEFNDGQHRICIAKHMRLQIETLITTIDEPCDVCLDDKRSRNSELR